MPRQRKPPGWIDFKAVKAAASFEAVLAHYDVAFTQKGDELTASCPFHEDKKPSFKVNVEKGVFNCFGCNAKGNVLEFVQRMDGGSLVQSARTVAKICGLDAGTGKEEEKPSASTRSKVAAPAKAEPEPVKENRPITISLQLDAEHEYLASRGLSAETIETFGLGYCSRGMMRGRIAIPIHNTKGELLAYAGRWVDGDDVPEGEGKYKLPPKFAKSLELYNLHRVPPEAKTVILVEGYFSVFWLAQHGYENVVALMGSTISERQRQLLCEHFRGVMIFLDGDEAGRKATADVASFLVHHLWVKAIACPEGKQPDELPESVLRQILG
jgi:DNA primase